MDAGTIAGLTVGIVVSLIIGGIIGYFVAMRAFKRQMKKHPPITPAQIKAIYQQMGRTPSESQIKAVMSKIKQG